MSKISGLGKHILNNTFVHRCLGIMLMGFGNFGVVWFAVYERHGYQAFSGTDILGLIITSFAVILTGINMFMFSVSDINRMANKQGIINPIAATIVLWDWWVGLILGIFISLATGGIYVSFFLRLL